MRALVVVVLLLVPAASSRGATTVDNRTAREPGCEILDYGNYRAESERVRYADQTSVTGERFEISSVRFVRQTKQIEASLGQRFGIRYRLRRLAQRTATITWRVTYPSPVRGSNGWEHSFRATPAGGELVQHLLYDFVFASEVVSGRWSFDVLVDGQRACSFAFSVR
jgi:hypothetical protein